MKQPLNRLSNGLIYGADGQIQIRRLTSVIVGVLGCVSAIVMVLVGIATILVGL